MTAAETLDALVAAPRRALLVSDVDGTLAPIVRRAEDARADPAAVAALARVAPHLGHVALLTGRPAATAVALGAFADVRGLEVLGHYGLDRWYDGRLSAPPPDPAVARARGQLPPLPEGAYVEDKELSFVVHTRPAADPDGALAVLDGPLRALAATEGLEVVDGSYARELRPAGVDKGTALRGLVAAHDPAVVAYLGDDDGDLPAAAALAGLRADGRCRTLLVVAAREGGSAALRAQADVVVEGVAGVTAWLQDLADRLERPQPDASAGAPSASS